MAGVAGCKGTNVPDERTVLVRVVVLFSWVQVPGKTSPSGGARLANSKPMDNSPALGLPFRVWVVSRSGMHQMNIVIGNENRKGSQQVDEVSSEMFSQI